jgi:hypothetical protein
VAAQSPHRADAGRELSTEESSRPFLCRMAASKGPDTVGEFVRAVEEAGFSSPRSPILSRLRLIGRSREFANSIHVDTGGEFAWVIWNRGFPLPARPSLPKLRFVDRQREFPVLADPSFTTSADYGVALQGFQTGCVTLSR